MRTIRLLGSVALFLIFLAGAVCYAQSPPANGVPLISQVTPPNLQVPANPPVNGSFTLTILGANFPANAVVNLTAPGFTPHLPFSTSVNGSGSQIVAQFSNSILTSPATFALTITNPSGNPPATSNAFYLPETPVAPSVALNQNTSTFLPGAPKGILAGFFGSSSILDLAVVSQNSNTVSILASDFSGPIVPGAAYPTGNQPWGIAAGDFLGDGQLDLAISNSTDNTVTILLASGSATFAPGNTIQLPGVFPTQIVAADFNGDGKMDLAVLNTC